MSDESKPYPASDLKLERLREQGIVPYSPEVETASVMLGIFVACLLLSAFVVASFPEFLTQAFSFRSEQAHFSDGNLDEAMQPYITSASSQLLLSLGILLVPLVGIVLLSGFVQTRFLFVFGALQLQFGRLFSLSSLSPRAYFSRFLSACTAALLCLLSFALLFVVLRYCLESLGDSGYASKLWYQPSIAPDASRAMDWPFTNFMQSTSYFVVGMLFGASALLAIGAYFTRLFRFKTMHRMSRAELEAEYREMGPSPELRSAQTAELMGIDENESS